MMFGGVPAVGMQPCAEFCAATTILKKLIKDD